MRSPASSILMPDVLLVGYRNGFFPMAEERSGRIVWHRPDPRAIIPLDDVHISRSLLKTLRKRTFRITMDTAFREVITQCADRDQSWISPEIIQAYCDLHESGHAHSIESWVGEELVGGLYGVSLAGAFFGESMFSRRSDASKVAFAHLIAVLRLRGFRLLDTQYINDFTESLGAVEIPDAIYQLMLADALDTPAIFSDISETDARD
ncbi:MAG: leucyl/phenylalanyl-tRNA--protein transferase ['Candidatus Kapabacteria' thiocyanatum]|uniref:Leucyl/phenylalanyl-tRNA--protein transferase n=1 Tax=Candidatus Kapaibacterium thiocyanatum TaxID=1895771 RepID=A0A1M3KUY6_9BACT|nr:leucyl/phenylalanyl-tRNA--protein transferase ['Candidatus Kapabacteria' thiocyanatum]OJX56209.1 MAG: leucyl/phenylalanyl-tRNA--protein transferase ['Candidatus Kapabacteria' thiocyanatum]